jgi:hypothetical protein
MVPCITPLPWQNSGYAHEKYLIQASASAADGFSNSFTWAALITALGMLLGVVYRWYDKRNKQLEKDYALLDEVVVELDKLAVKAATKDDLYRLKELLSLIKQAERRFPKILFGTVVATIEAYEKSALTKECAKGLTRVLTDKKSVNAALELSRQQGARIADIRTAVNTVQRDIDRQLRR